MDVTSIIVSFEDCAKKQYHFTLEGNWRKGNEQVKKMNELFARIKDHGDEARNKLLDLTNSNSDEVASMAAVYSMRFNPEKCLKTLQGIAEKNIPLLSSDAKQAIENWNNKEWYID